MATYESESYSSWFGEILLISLLPFPTVLTSWTSLPLPTKVMVGSYFGNAGIEIKIQNKIEFNYDNIILLK